jgi:hypothetical protein
MGRYIEKDEDEKEKGQFVLPEWSAFLVAMRCVQRKVV